MLDLVFDRTQSDVANDTEKGYYNYEDLNRVGSAIEYLTTFLLDSGYYFQTAPKTDWTEQDIPTQAQMQQYITDIQTLRNCLTYTAPDAPDTIQKLTYKTANDIERILNNLEQVLLAMQSAFLTRQANTIFMIAGGVFNAG